MPWASSGRHYVQHIHDLVVPWSTIYPGLFLEEKEEGEGINTS